MNRQEKTKGVNVLLFYSREAVVTGDEFIDSHCPACQASKWRAVSILKYVSFTIFPLFPFKKMAAQQCNNCFRIIQTEKKAPSYTPPKVSKGTVFSTWFGTPLLMLISFLLSSYLSFIELEQERVRSHPKHGDILFLNYFNLTKDEKQLRYPIRIAKVEKFDQVKNQVILKLSSFKYRYSDGATLDYRGRSYLFGSYFAKKQLVLPLNALSDKSVFYDVKRPFYNIDVEIFQTATKFEKTYLEYPR